MCPGRMAYFPVNCRLPHLLGNEITCNVLSGMLRTLLAVDINQWSGLGINCDSTAGTKVLGTIVVSRD